MRRRHQLIGALVVTCLSCWWTAPGLAQVTPGPCEGAQALLDAKLYDSALALYGELLKATPAPTPEVTPQATSPAVVQFNCARVGIEKAALAKLAEQARQQVRKGLAHEDADQLDQARDAYLEALAIEPDQVEARAGLHRVIETQRVLAARGLKRQGLYDAAADRLKKAVEENPSAVVPADLVDLLETDEPSFAWTGQRGVRYVQRGADFVGTILAVVIGPLLLLSVMWLKVWPFVYDLASRTLRLDIQEFDKGASGLDIGKGLSQMVEEAFRRFDEPGSAHRPDLVTGSIQPFALPSDVTSATPQLKWISAAIQWLFPPNIVTLSGCLQKAGERGAGLTLQFSKSKDGQIMASQTFWQKEFDPSLEAGPLDSPAAYYCLAEPAANWAVFQLELYDRHHRME